MAAIVCSERQSDVKLETNVYKSMKLLFFQNKRGRMRKRGQVTLFIILGALLLVGLLLFVVF